MIGWRQAILLITVGRSWRNSVLRVGLALPMTPWPVLLAIRNQGMVLRSGGRHSAEALHAVFGPALWIVFLVHSIAVLIAQTSKASPNAKGLLIGLVGVNFLFMVAFLSNHSHAYN